jgi:hypothetical protein
MAVGVLRTNLNKHLKLTEKIEDGVAESLSYIN